MKVTLPIPTFNLSIHSPSGKHYLIQNLPAIPNVGDCVMVGSMAGSVESGYVAGRRMWDFTSDSDIYVVHIKLVKSLNNEQQAGGSDER